MVYTSKKIFNNNYINITFKKNYFKVQLKIFKNFLKIKNINNFDIIEIHNRPNYIKLLKKIIIKKFFYISIMTLYQ